MTKLILKAALVTFIVCCLGFRANAQIGFDYSQYELGFGSAMNSVEGNAPPSKMTPSFLLHFTYNATPYVNYVFEMQLGRIAGGDSLSTTGRQFTGDLEAFVFRGQFQLGEILDYSTSPFKNAIKNLYVSAGIGYAVTHITSISRLNPAGGNAGAGQLNSQEPMVPLRIGYEFKIFNKYKQPACKIDLAYTNNRILSENFDGYALNNHDEAYSQISIGIKFAIGGAILSYKKLIPYNY
jgi:hypothetical protein